ncbi:ATP-binding protein, partial [Luteibacter sp.]|uniref:ATP-binding protein n=1 Tax=Luteibacter sp. TaxID=1886636 RepID=UPI003F8214A9
KQGHRQRSTLAYWAHPRTWKSSCIEALELIVPKQFPGAGILVHAAKRDTVVAEGSFIGDILLAMGYEAKLKRGLPERRDQLRRALFALGAGSSQLFLVIDEAQNLAAIQLEWLKEYINWLIKRRYKVTVILFGQQELTCKRDELIEVGRTDLHARFTENLMEFEGVTCGEDLLPLLKACDSGSEFPPGSGCSYTNFLWPEAFGAGFRLESQLPAIACAFELDSGAKRIDHGVIMEYVARALAEFAETTRSRDSAAFSPEIGDWMHAVELSGYRERAPFVYRRYTGPVPTSRSRKADQYA